jgi:Kef-type K+ transport system membrane component KefB
VVETQFNHPLVILLVGCIIVLAILVRSCFTRAGLPPLVGFILLGFLLNLADFQYTFLSPWAREIFKLLAEIGIITLLFRVGLESNIFKLLRQLRRASYIWISGVCLCAALGFGIAYYLVGLALIPSLFIAIALTATSLGVSVGIWQEAGAINSPTGELLIDVAELDDISAIFFMALLFAIAPVLETGDGVVLPLLGRTTVLLVIKLIVFGAGCYLLAHFLEQHLTKFFQKIGSPPAPMLVVVGIGFVIAALADLMGFSMALGAFFAGLVFSRDPDSVNIDAAFGSLFELLSPFFFIGIGLNLNPNLLFGALGLGLLLLLAAIPGKVVGHGAPTWYALGGSAAVLLGISMVPRAEIALIIMEQGLELGPWAVPPEAYAAMVMVSAMTCLFPPLIARSLLKRWPQPQEESPA